MQPDWDMFQSSHERGAFHAAARVVSGGPVYVSNKVGAHDFELLRKMVLSDGSVLRADLPGRPTLDCPYDHSIEFSYDQTGGRLATDIPVGHSNRLVIRWP